MRNFVLEELADALDDRSGQFRYYFIQSSSRIEPYAADDPAAVDCGARADSIAVEPLSHADAHAMIRDFIDTLADGELSERLGEAAMSPSSARFLQVLGAYPRARRVWLSYRQRRLEAIALDWLRQQEVDLRRLGLDHAPRPEEEAIGLRFDADLDPKLAALGDRVRALWRRGAAALANTVAERAQIHLDDIYHSNALRGNRLDRAQTEALVVRGETVGGLTLREHLEAVNLHKALLYAEAIAKSRSPLSEVSVRELHRILFAAIDDENAGTYRRIDTRIVGRDYLPPESSLVPGLLREFTEWLDETSAHPVTKAAAAQAKLQNLSPFLDGNGRVARLISTLTLFEAGYPPAVIRMDDAERYYEGLRCADAGDLTALLALMIERVDASVARLESAAA